jgi:hypothetical protein
VNANWMPRIVSVIRQEPKAKQEPVDKAPKVLQVEAPKQEAPKPQQAPKQEEAPKKQQEKYATCAEATSKVQGYTFVQQALAQCPELQAMQQDPNVAKTFFVPSDKVRLKATSTHARQPPHTPSPLLVLWWLAGTNRHTSVFADVAAQTQTQC